MTSVSNQIEPSAFFTCPSFSVTHIASPTFSLPFQTTEEFEYLVHKALKTPNPRKIDSLTVRAISSDSSDSQICGWHLLSTLLVQLRRSRKTWVATTWLESVAEYGAGDTEVEAIEDLITSLGEYCLALEKRENQLGESAQRELARLRALLQH